MQVIVNVTFHRRAINISMFSSSDFHLRGWQFFNLISIVIVSTAKIVSSITILTEKTSIDRFVSDLAFILLTFEEIDHQYNHETSNVMINIVKIIITSHNWSTISFFKRIKNTRNSSTKFISYFTIWAIDRRAYKFALQHFYNQIEKY